MRTLIGQENGSALPSGAVRPRPKGQHSTHLATDARSALSTRMFRKTLSRTFTQRRAFHSSAPAHRVVATNPVQAQEVKVGIPSAYRTPRAEIGRAHGSHGLLGNTHSSSTSTTLLSCESFLNFSRSVARNVVITILTLCSMSAVREEQVFELLLV
jgi:hypothetical protein